MKQILTALAIVAVVSATAQSSFRKDGILWVSNDNPKARVMDFYPVKVDTTRPVSNYKDVCPICGQLDCEAQTERKKRAKKLGVTVQELINKNQSEFTRIISAKW